MYQKHKEFLDVNWNSQRQNACVPQRIGGAMITAWEADPDAPDPYSEPAVGK